MSILTIQPLLHVRDEFRLSMRRLLSDLCRELQIDYPDSVSRFGLPVEFFQTVGQSLKLEAFSNWKAVGWIEGLNDLVYFLDLLEQWKRERRRQEFAEQLLLDCEETFFEHGYKGDLFPSGAPEVGGLERRLTALCEKLSQELVQESLFFDPVVTVKWSRLRKHAPWQVSGALGVNFERAEPLRSLPVGVSGARCEPPEGVRRALKRSKGQVTFRVESTSISVEAGGLISILWSGSGEKGQWHWTLHPATVALEGSGGQVTVGPTLVYGRDRQPRTVVPTNTAQVKRIGQAWNTIEQAWPEGHQLMALFTSRVIPLKAKGVVSFSYRHRPGLSFINCFDRDKLDLIDDLIHENSHHHLNLLLRKHVMYHGDHNQQIFYSPWRRSLRPLRGILHATFTFTMGAMLFERLSVWAAGKRGAASWKKAGLTARDLDRARFRCLEEVESVRHSLQDLHYADHHLGWLTGSGRRLVGQLAEAIGQVERSIAGHRKDVLHSEFGLLLSRHRAELQKARTTYGPMRLSKA